MLQSLKINKLLNFYVLSKGRNIPKSLQLNWSIELISEKGLLDKYTFHECYTTGGVFKTKLWICVEYIFVYAMN